MITFFDLETRALAQDYDHGWPEFMHDGGGGISALALLIEETVVNPTDVFQETTRSRVNLADDKFLVDAVATLNTSERIVSWNGRSFDVPIINHWSDDAVEPREHCDLMQMLRKVTGRRWKLNDVAEATLGYGKCDSAILAPQMARDGEFGRLFHYCLDDVYLTRDLYFAILNGCVVLPDGREVTKEELFDDYE